MEPREGSDAAKPGLLAERSDAVAALVGVNRVPKDVVKISPHPPEVGGAVDRGRRRMTWSCRSTAA